MPITVRVIEYTLSHPSRDPGEAPIRLVTTMLDPGKGPRSSSPGSTASGGRKRAPSTS
jgi:hypothetical protein